MKSKSSPKLRPNLFDGLVALLVAALAIGTAIWFYGGLGGGDSGSVVVTHRGQEVAKVPLGQPREITIAGDYHLTITFDGEKVWVSQSDCPTQDCVRTGVITRPGQSIICLPEQVIVKIVGDSGGGPDIVIG